MAINYTRLFTTLGKIVGGLDEANTYRGTTLAARADTLSARFDAALQDTAEGLYPALESGQGSLDSWVAYLSDLAADTIQAEVAADRDLPDLSLTTAILELDRQMRADVESLEDSDAAVVVTPNLTDGTAVLIGTALQPTGVAAPLALADSYAVTVPRGRLGGDTQFQEILDIVGTREAVPSTSWEWPGGSGVSASVSVRDPHFNVGLTNGRLSSVTGWTQSPDGEWTADAATTAPRTGYTANVTHLDPTGASATLSQEVDIQARTIYAWTLKVFKDAGVQDWSVGVRLKDGAGVTIPGLTSTHTAASLSAGWNTLTGFFVTPEAWDGEAEFEVSYSAIVTQTNLEVAHAGIDSTTPLYTGGPTLFAWAGTEPLTTRDEWDVDVTVGGTGALHRGVDRLVDLRSVLPHGLPTSTVATQADALVS